MNKDECVDGLEHEMAECPNCGCEYCSTCDEIAGSETIKSTNSPNKTESSANCVSGGSFASDKEDKPTTSYSVQDTSNLNNTKENQNG